MPSCIVPQRVSPLSFSLSLSLSFFLSLSLCLFLSLSVSLSLSLSKLQTNYTHSFCFFLALYNYEAKEDDEIELSKDDVLSVYEVDESGWFRGENHRTKKVGLFPGEYVIFNTSSPAAVKGRR